MSGKNSVLSAWHLSANSRPDPKSGWAGVANGLVALNSYFQVAALSVCLVVQSQNWKRAMRIASLYSLWTA